MIDSLIFVIVATLAVMQSAMTVAETALTWAFIAFVGTVLIVMLCVDEYFWRKNERKRNARGGKKSR